MQSGETLFEPFAKLLDAFTVNPTSPVIGFDPLPRDLQVLPFVDLVDERVILPRPRWIDPVCESPRSVMFGSFAELLVLFGRPTTPRTLLPISLALIGSLPSVPPEDPESPPGVTLRSSVPCRPHTPCCGGWMRTPSPP